MLFIFLYIFVHSSNVADTRSTVKQNANLAYVGAAEAAKLINYVNKIDYFVPNPTKAAEKNEQKDVPVDRKIYESMKLLQRNYDTGRKFNDVDKGSLIRVHLIQNPEVLKTYRKNLVMRNNHFDEEEYFLDGGLRSYRDELGDGRIRMHILKNPEVLESYRKHNKRIRSSTSDSDEDSDDDDENDSDVEIVNENDRDDDDEENYNDEESQVSDEDIVAANFRGMHRQRLPVTTNFDEIKDITLKPEDTFDLVKPFIEEMLEKFKGTQVKTEKANKKVLEFDITTKDSIFPEQKEVDIDTTEKERRSTKRDIIIKIPKEYWVDTTTLSSKYEVKHNIEPKYYLQKDKKNDFHKTEKTFSPLKKIKRQDTNENIHKKVTEGKKTTRETTSKKENNYSVTESLLKSKKAFTHDSNDWEDKGYGMGKSSNWDKIDKLEQIERKKRLEAEKQNSGIKWDKDIDWGSKEIQKDKDRFNDFPKKENFSNLSNQNKKQNNHENSWEEKKIYWGQYNIDNNKDKQEDDGIFKGFKDKNIEWKKDDSGLDWTAAKRKKDDEWDRKEISWDEKKISWDKDDGDRKKSKKNDWNKNDDEWGKKDSSRNKKYDDFGKKDSFGNKDDDDFSKKDSNRNKKKDDWGKKDYNRDKNDDDWGKKDYNRDKNDDDWSKKELSRNKNIDWNDKNDDVSDKKKSKWNKKDDDWNKKDDDWNKKDIDWKKKDDDWKKNDDDWNKKEDSWKKKPDKWDKKNDDWDKKRDNYDKKDDWPKKKVNKEKLELDNKKRDSAWDMVGVDDSKMGSKGKKNSDNTGWGNYDTFKKKKDLSNDGDNYKDDIKPLPKIEFKPVKPIVRDDYVPKHDNFERPRKPSRHGSFERKAPSVFGRTPIPIVGKKAVYAD